MAKFVVARTARKRPTLMHALNPERPGYTLCGVDIAAWSRAYFDAPIPQIECLRCKGVLQHG